MTYSFTKTYQGATQNWVLDFNDGTAGVELNFCFVAIMKIWVSLFIKMKIHASVRTLPSDCPQDRDYNPGMANLAASVTGKCVISKFQHLLVGLNIPCTVVSLVRLC